MNSALRLVRAIARVLGHFADRDLLHRLEYVVDRLSAADRVKAVERVGLVDCAAKLIHEIVVGRVDDMLCAKPLQQLDLAVLANNIDEVEPVFLADLDQHLAEVRSTNRVNDCLLPIHLGILGKAECGHRVDESACPVLRRVIAQRQAHGGVSDAILAVCVTRHTGDALAVERLGHIAITCCYDRACTFIAGGELLPMACL